MRGDLLASVQHLVQIAAHIAYAGDAVRKKQRKDQIVTVHSGTAKVDMRMHVPKAGDQILSLRIHHLPRSGTRFSRPADADDTIAADHNCRIRLNPARGDVDQTGMGDRQCPCLRPRRQRSQKRQSKQKSLKDSHKTIVLPGYGRGVPAW